MTRQQLTPQFKLDTASLILDQGQSIAEICRNMGLKESTVHKWVTNLKAERTGQVPLGVKPISPDQIRIRELENKVKNLEAQCDMLKKASALLGLEHIKNVK